MEHHVTKKLLLSGFDLIGLRVYEALVALKYLASQPEVRAAALGLIGHSGGSSTGNLLVRIAPERIRAYVSDHKVNYYAIPSPEPYHCETAPPVYPYHALINDFSTLPIARMEVPYAEQGCPLEVRGSLAVAAIAHTLPFDDPQKLKRTAKG